MGFEWEASSSLSLKKGEVAHRRRLLTLKRCCLGPMSIVAIVSPLEVDLVGVETSELEGESEWAARGRWKLLNRRRGTMLTESSDSDGPDEKKLDS